MEGGCAGPSPKRRALPRAGQFHSYGIVSLGIEDPAMLDTVQDLIGPLVPLNLVDARRLKKDPSNPQKAN
jgi:hypothetical protein